MGAQAAALYTGRIYPGLRPFDAEEALLFFGRDTQTDELLCRLEDTRFLAVVGLSGSGKSSLVKAGLLPALHRGHLSGAGAHWRVAVMRPGADPLGALARVLDETLGKREDRLRTLRSGSLGLVDTSRHGRDANENILLVVDQFEEIFRFQDSNPARAGEASEFVELLLAATRDYEPAYRTYVVLTLRSDYLGGCARFRGLPEALNDSQYLVPRMTRAQLHDAIEGPAALGGVDLSADLLEELLDKTSDDPDQLPVLQHLLLRMWEIRAQAGARSRIGREQYKAVGGWDDALDRNAEAVWKALKDRCDLAKRIFQRLTEKAQAGREVRRPATVCELADVAEAAADKIREVVEHFRQEGCNFLTSPDGQLTDDSVIDISHESLIRRWKSLNEWVTEEADWGVWYRRIEDRIRIGVTCIVDPELESALQAREKGRWNEAWAERYVTEKEGVKLAYGEVIRFLEASERRRSDAVRQAKEAAEAAAQAERQAREAAEARADAERRAKDAAELLVKAERRTKSWIFAFAILGVAALGYGFVAESSRRAGSEKTLHEFRNSEAVLRQQITASDDILKQYARQIADLRDQVARAKAPAEKKQLQSKLSDLVNQDSLVRKERDSIWSAPQLSETAKLSSRVNPADGLTYVFIPPGKFMMGCSPGDSECADDEKPPHAEQIANGFWLGRTEVTQAAWAKVKGGNPSHFKSDLLPVEGVDWTQAGDYCKIIGGRLPTEKEWEYATRAGTTGARYGPLDAVAWYSGNSGEATHPVGLKQPNAFGLHDMLGNVWEWTSDDYDAGRKVLCGGSWYDSSGYVRASVRLGRKPSVRYSSFGFRCVGEFR